MRDHCTRKVGRQQVLLEKHSDVLAQKDFASNLNNVKAEPFAKAVGEYT